MSVRLIMVDVHKHVTTASDPMNVLVGMVMNWLMIATPVMVSMKCLISSYISTWL